MQSAATLQASTGQGRAASVLCARPDAPTRQRLVAAVAGAARAHATAGRWLDPAGYHLTLLNRRLRTAGAGVGGAGLPPPRRPWMRCFRAAVDQAGSFASRDHPRWLGGAARAAGAVRTVAAVGLGADRAGVPRESCRDFVPHLTVLRRARLALPVTELEPLVWPVDAFVLVASAAAPRRALSAGCGVSPCAPQGRCGPCAAAGESGDSWQRQAAAQRVAHRPVIVTSTNCPIGRPSALGWNGEVHEAHVLGAW